MSSWWTAHPTIAGNAWSRQMARNMPQAVVAYRQCTHAGPGPWVQVCTVQSEWQHLQPVSLTRSHDEHNGSRDEHPSSVAGVNSLQLRFLAHPSNIATGGGHKPARQSNHTAQNDKDCETNGGTDLLWHSNISNDINEAEVSSVLCKKALL
jgi:hypothetical protein